jgi:hypothetical protein
LLETHDILCGALQKDEDSKIQAKKKVFESLARKSLDALYVENADQVTLQIAATFPRLALYCFENDDTIDKLDLSTFLEQCKLF